MVTSQLKVVCFTRLVMPAASVRTANILYKFSLIQSKKDTNHQPVARYSVPEKRTEPVVRLGRFSFSPTVPFATNYLPVSPQTPFEINGERTRACALWRWLCLACSSILCNASSIRSSSLRRACPFERTTGRPEIAGQTLER